MFKKGFTLIELLVVIGIIAILAVIVLVAVNPARQFAQSRNTARQNDVNTILNATQQNAIDHNGILPIDNNGVAIALCTAVPTAAATMSTALVPAYVSSMPVDPSGTDYTLCRDANNRLTVNAPGAELGAAIRVTR